MSKVGSSESLNATPELPLPTVLESIPDAVVVADAFTDEIVAVNDAAGELFDCESDVLIGMDRLELHPQDKEAAYDEAFGRALKGERVNRLQDGTPLHIETWSGERVAVEINSERIQNRNQTLVLGVFRDISNQIERQQQLEATTNRLETLLDAAPVPVVVLDTQGNVQSWNQAAEETFGYDYEDIVNEPLPLFPDTEDFETLLGQILDGGMLEGYETVLRMADGTRRHTELYARPLYDDDEITGIIGAAVDITERKRRRQGLEILHRVLRHDLRNKLTVIQGHASGLAEDRERSPEAEQKAAERIVAATDELASLSTQIAQSKMLGDQSTVPTASTELRKLRTTIESITPDSTEVSVDRGEIDDTVAIPESANAAVSQLLSHVIEYMRQPTIDIGIQSRETSVQLTIRSDAPLLSEGHRELISNGAETKLDHGLGLDMVNVHLTLMQVGGNIQLIGDPTPETAVQITLPHL